MTDRPTRALDEAGADTLLKVSELKFRWPEAQRDLLDIPRFELAPGERVFLQGASGSGKSSLLALLGGVARPRSGDITLLGHTVNTLPQRRVDQLRADHIGFIFQQFNLVPYLSARQNVMLPCRFSRRRRLRAQTSGGESEVEVVRLLAHLELSEQGLLDRPVTGLSIGQQQRVAAARALIGAPDLIIADEPTSALDEGTRERFLDLLFRECEARAIAILFVSHDARIGSLFDRRISLRDLNQAEALTA